MKNSIDKTPAYITRDQSEIRELLHPLHHPAKNQSLAEARVAPGLSTQRHFHKQTEEIYFILQGKGEMFLDGDTFTVKPGDSILIKPGQHHCISNKNDSTLRFLCCCAPAYAHDDTYLLE